MKKNFTVLLLFILINLITIQLNAQNIGFPDLMYTKAERTNYEETSLHSDVMNFVNSLVQNTGLANLEIIGTSYGGREIPLVIMADPPVSTPEEAVESGKLVLYIQANIHAGEVEGKESSMEIMREIAFGPKRTLLKNQIILFCPIYNTDGNDALSPNNRGSQDGSPIEAGERYSGEGYDLNRDGLKIDAIETKAMMSNVMNKWNPEVFVDLHTTNGVWHGYTITYAAGMHTAGHPGTYNYLMDQLFPFVTNKVKERSGIDTYLYGSFSNYPPQEFEAGPYMPRFLWNSMALKNKLGILVETFAHDKFEKRILSNNLFLTSLFEYTSNNFEEIQNLVDNINDEVISEISDNGGILQKGVSFETAERGSPTDLLVYEVLGGYRTGKRVWVSNVKMMQNHIPTKLATVPKAYVFSSELTNVADKLIEHGIDVDTLSINTSFSGEEYIISDFSQDTYAYQKHFRTRIQGSFEAKSKEMPAGSFYVNMAQPYAYCIFYMLEPESDDGLVLWNFFDNYLIGHGVLFASKPYPVFKVFDGEMAGIDEEDIEQKILVYPNPGTDIINIELNITSSQLISLELINPAGKVLVKESIVPGHKQKSLDLSNLPKGNYYLQVKSGSFSEVRNIILN